MKKLIMNKRFRVPILIFLAGLILMLSANAVFPKKTESEQAKTVHGDVKNESTVYGRGENLTQDIKNLIESINGVKSAAVVITFDNSGEIRTEKDVNTNKKSTEESDGAGGNREVIEHTEEEETIYKQNSDGSKEPFVISEKYAEIRGVAIVVKGAYDEAVREKIIRMLEVLLNISAHKIQVIW